VTYELASLIINRREGSSSIGRPSPHKANDDTQRCLLRSPRRESGWSLKQAINSHLDDTRFGARIVSCETSGWNQFISKRLELVGCDEKSHLDVFRNRILTFLDTRLIASIRRFLSFLSSFYCRLRSRGFLIVTSCGTFSFLFPRRQTKHWESWSPTSVDSIWLMSTWNTRSLRALSLFNAVDLNRYKFSLINAVKISF